MLLQLDRNGFTRVLPLARRRIQVPIGQAEVCMLPLLNLRRSRLQILRVVNLLLPEVDLEVLVLACEHHLVVQGRAFRALQPIVLLPDDGGEDFLPRFFLSHNGPPYSIASTED